MAIAYNSDIVHNNSASGASPSISFTAPSTPSIVWAAISTVDTETVTATYKGNAMTQADVGTGASNHIYLFFINNPSSGSGTVQFTKSGTGSCDFNVWSYGDSSAAGVGLDQHNNFTGTNAVISTLTPTTTGMWMVVAATSSGSNPAASTGSTLRSNAASSRNIGSFDSNAGLTGGAPNAMTITCSGAGATAAATFNIVAVSTTVIKTFYGVANASVKTIQGVTNAATKTWDGVANA